MSKFTDNMKTAATNGAALGFLGGAVLTSEASNPIPGIAATVAAATVANVAHKFVTHDSSKPPVRSIFQASPEGKHLGRQWKK